MAKKLKVAVFEGMANPEDIESRINAFLEDKGINGDDIFLIKQSSAITMHEGGPRRVFYVTIWYFVK